MMEIIEYNHKDIERWKKTGDDFLSDESGHGTSILNILWKKYPTSKYLIAKALDNEHKGYSVVLIEALRRMIGQQPNMINISVGMRDENYCKELYSLTKTVKDKGINIFLPCKWSK